MSIFNIYLVSFCILTFPSCSAPFHVLFALFLSCSEPFYVLFALFLSCSAPFHVLFTLFLSCSEPLYVLFALFLSYSAPFYVLFTLFLSCSKFNLYYLFKIILCSSPVRPFLPVLPLDVWLFTPPPLCPVFIPPPWTIYPFIFFDEKSFNRSN